MEGLLIRGDGEWMVVGLKLVIDVAAVEARIVLVFLHHRRLSVDVITCLSVPVKLVPVVGRCGSRKDYVSKGKQNGCRLFHDSGRRA